mgnify:FL=1
MPTSSRRLRRAEITAPLCFLILCLFVQGCSVPITTEPPVVVGTVRLAPSSLTPERYVLTVPLLNRGSQCIDQFSITARVVPAIEDDTGGSAARGADSQRQLSLNVPTHIPGNQRREERVVFDCPFSVVPAAGIELHRLRFTEFIVAGRAVPGEIQYPMPLHGQGTYE